MIIKKLPSGDDVTVDDQDAHILDRAWWVKRDRHTLYAARKGVPGVDDTSEVLLHREVMGCRRGDPMVDHKDGNGLNCVRNNLRKVGHVVNARNRSGAQSNNLTSGFLGINFYRNRWQVRIRVNRRRVYVGSFEFLDAAVIARARAEQLFWGSEPRRVDVLHASLIDNDLRERHLSATSGVRPHIEPEQPASPPPSGGAGDGGLS